MKRRTVAAGAAAVLMAALAGCGMGASSGSATSTNTPAPTSGGSAAPSSGGTPSSAGGGTASSSGATTSSSSAPVTIKVAAFLGGYGEEMYQQVVEAYKTVNPNVTVDLDVSKTIAQELTPQVAAGTFPDVVVLGIGGEAGFTDGFVRDKGLEDLTSVLSTTVPGEKTTVGDKLTPGIVGNLVTNPYGDDKTYLMPMYASPTGLVYDKGLFAREGWTVPTTWDEMWALGDKAKAKGISLFTYPTSGYLDSFFFALLATVGGEDFYRDAMTYQTDVWKSDKANEVFGIVQKLLSYAAPTTVGYANKQDFTKNQQSILDDKVLFMPNGAWISNEMKDAPRATGFEWGMIPVPALASDGTRYVTTFTEQAWVPAQAQQKDAAKQFIAFLYSDKAAAIFAKANAIQPIKDIGPLLSGDGAAFSKVYDEKNVKALVGGFAATKPVAGVDLKATLFGTADGVLSASTTVADWQSAVNDASNQLTGQLASDN